jgi:ubiquinone/menaquinone biosynthesis C-methylase UbiE
MKCRKPAVLHEIKRANLSPGDKTLVIGCGIFPSTSIVITEESNVHVTGIDNNIKVIHIARSYMEKKKLTNKVCIEYGDGLNYPVRDFDVIFIAINVWPIDQILIHLAQNMKTGSRLMCRSLKNDISDIFCKKQIPDVFILNSSSEYPMVTFSKYPMIQSFLFIKK